MAIISAVYYDQNIIHTTLKALADQINTTPFTGSTGPAGPTGPLIASPTGPTGATGPASPNTRFIPPMTDPKQAGKIWNNTGILTISQGW